MTLKPFEGFDLALAFQSDFKTTISDIQVVKRWSPGTAEGAGPGFSECIYGKAIVVHNEVCVVGTQRRTNELLLTLRSDHKAREEWEWIKGRDNVGVEEDAARQLRDTPEYRLIELMHETFAKSPPTAALFEDWGFECKIPQSVLSQLVTDLSAQLVDTFEVTVRWQNAGIKQLDSRTQVPGSLSTWGLFTLPGRSSAEPLKGHVSLLRWQPVGL